MSALGAEVRDNLDLLGEVVDAAAAGEVWAEALAADHLAPPVWVHGDVTGTNLVVRDGRLAGVLDFGCCAAPTAEPGRGARADRRVGWRVSAREVIADVLA